MHPLAHSHEETCMTLQWPEGKHPESSSASSATHAFIERERAFGAHNYDPLPVVLAHGAGAWVTDVDGRRFLDLMSAYSAVSFGHAHPQILAALIAQAKELAVTSRAFHNSRLPVLMERITHMTGLGRAGDRSLLRISPRTSRRRRSGRGRERRVKNQPRSGRDVGAWHPVSVVPAGARGVLHR